MCDYSLMNIPNRLAVDGEELLVHRFPSGSKGLASPCDLHRNSQPQISFREVFWNAVKKFFNPETCSVPAVCIPPSSRLLLHGIDERMQRQYALHAEEQCTFEQLTEAAHTYRDAIRFRNGCCVKLQELTEGQQVTVLSTAVLDEDPKSAPEPDDVLIRQCA